MDSEFYHPKYIQAEAAVNKVGKIIMLGSLGKFLIGPFGSAFHVSNYDPNSSYRYIRGKDVKPFQLLDDDNVYMPEKDYLRLIKYAVIPGDILITVVGTLGNVAIVPEGNKGVFSCKSTIFRGGLIDPYYLIAYLNSEYGKQCLLRRQRGAIQAGLNKDDLKTIPVPIFTDEIHKSIGNKIKKSLNLNELSKSLYNKATKLLEQELVLNKILFNKEVSYKAKYSELVVSQRLDSNHFKPKFNQLINHLRSNFKCSLLGELASINRRGVQPIYIQNGNRKVINSQHITPTHLSYESFEETDSKLFNACPQAHVKYGDILTYTTGAYVGQTNPYLSEEPALASNHVNILRIKNPDIDPVFIALVMNSIVGKLQTEKHIRGSAQAELYPNDIAKFIIPILDYQVMVKIGDMVKQSLIASQDSKRLLEQAKSEVETLIEQAANR